MYIITSSMDAGFGIVLRRTDQLRTTKIPATKVLQLRKVWASIKILQVATNALQPSPGREPTVREAQYDT